MVIDLYTDGSYNINEPSVTYGSCVAVDMNKNPLFAQRYYSSRSYWVSMRNTGGELLAAAYGCIALCNYLKGILKLDKIGELECTIRIYHDHTGVRDLVYGHKPLKQGTMQYCLLMDRMFEMCPKVKFEYYKVTSHSGNTWNEVADSLSRGVVDKRIEGVLIDDYAD